MTLRHMQIFVTVCDCATVTEAARRMYLAQSAVSLAISELEKYYGVRLFDRITKRLHLTEPGRIFLGYARHILESVAEMEQRVMDQTSWGYLRIGASITIGTDLLPDLVVQFQKDYPNIKLRVTIDQSSIIEQKIIKNELDLAMIEGQVHDKHIVSKEFMNDKLVVVGSSKTKLLLNETVPLSHIKDRPFILREKGSGTRELFDSIMLTHGYLIVPIWESISTEAIIRAVTADIGLSVLPFRLVESDLDKGNLVRIFISDAQFSRQFRLIYHKDKYLNDVMEAFIQML